jgi:hypothetical protein
MDIKLPPPPPLPSRSSHHSSSIPEATVVLADENIPVYEGIPVSSPVVEGPNEVDSSTEARYLVSQSIDEAGTRSYLFSHGWSLGMQNTLINGLKKVPIRFFICDDSGSMMTEDGHRLVKNDTNVRYVGGCRHPLYRRQSLYRY